MGKADLPTKEKHRRTIVFLFEGIFWLSAAYSLPLFFFLILYFNFDPIVAFLLRQSALSLIAGLLVFGGISLFLLIRFSKKASAAFMKV